MPVMGFVKFEQFFRVRGRTRPTQRRTRGIIEPWDLPITRGSACSGC